ANNGPASTYFEYWKSADPANKLTTPVRNWPAGASAPFGELVQHLSPSTAYSFRLCGNDQGKSPICVTTKQFTTGVARSHLDYNSSTGTWEFQDDPGVNSNMDALYNCNFLGFCDSVFEERSSCGSESGLTCGSQIVAPNSCQVGGGGTDSSAVCAVSESVAVKLGDLDDRAVVEGSGWSRATIDGGSGDDSLYYLGAYAPGRTMTGGTGRDILWTDQGNDTINARSAGYLDPDIDQSIRCGDGDDTVYADRSDPISAGENGCEHVYKP
ncbi:MAG: hypothetical protein WB866_07825, partial [Solirubrobacterales bacterium]